VDILFVLSEGFPCLLMLGQPSSNGASFLLTEIEGKIFLSLVELSEVLTLLLVGDGQNACYRFADSVNPSKFGSRTTSNLLDSKSQQLLLQFAQLFCQIILRLGLEFVCLDFPGHCFLEVGGCRKVFV